MRISVLFAAALALFQFNSSHAAEPSIGNWYNPNENGRGWNIERQNDLITIMHYVYDSAGRPTFYINTGTWNDDTKIIQGEYYSFSGGQCIGCSHSEPTARSLGTVKFKFSTSTKGEVTYPNGTTIPIEKMNYGYQSDLHKLQGGWSTAWYSSGIGFSHAFYSNAIEQSDGFDLVVGKKVFSSAGRFVATGYESGIYLALIDASTNYYDYYYYLMDGELIEGLACTGRKTSDAPSLNSCRGIVYGSRTHTLSEAIDLHGKSLQDETTLDIGDALREGLVIQSTSKSEALMEKMAEEADEASAAMNMLRLSLEKSKR